VSEECPLAKLRSSHKIKSPSPLPVEVYIVTRGRH
jgi:hypothetical protein